MADRGAGLEASQLSVPDWINEINELFPTEGIERLERDAVETYGSTSSSPGPTCSSASNPTRPCSGRCCRPST